MIKIEMRPKAETIVIIGAPGSGKDTQAQFLVEALGYLEISSGQLIRQRATHDDEIREVLESGGLVDDGLVDDEIISVFALLPEEQPVIINGYPRTLEQAQKLTKILSENNRKIDRVVYIAVRDENLIKRIGKRRICELCGHFTDDSKPSCSDCGGVLVLRGDDKPEAVEKRLKLFHQETEPVANYYRNLGILSEVDGNGSINEVRESIKKVL